MEDSGLNILITGSEGYIGRGMTVKLLDEGHTVIEYSRDVKQPYENPKHIFTHGDLLDTARMITVLKEYNVDRIIHIAAQSSHIISFDVPFETVQSNITCTVSLLEAARICGIKRVVLYSSEAAYGDHGDTFMTLDKPLVPRTPYGVTKATTEMLGRAYNWSFGMDCVSLRVCMVYGGRQYTPNFVKMAIESGLRGEKFVMENGISQNLNMVHIEDAVTCSYNAIFAENINELAVYNVVSHFAKFGDILELLKEIIPGYEYDVGPGILTEQQGQWDIKDTERDLNFTPKYTVNSGIAKYVEFLKNGG